MIKIIKNILNSLYQVLGLPYIVIKKVLQVLVQVIKKSYSVIGSLINTVADLVNKGIKGLINGLVTVLNWMVDFNRKCERHRWYSNNYFYSCMVINY